MKTILILAHPNFKESKINKTWIESLPKDDENITVRDLYTLYSNESINVQLEQQVLEQYDRIFFQFPLFWYSSPSLLKKWFDEVFTYGWAYGSSGDKLKGKEMGIIVSTGGPKDAYQAGGYNQYTLSELLRPFQATANLVGATYLPIHTYHGALSWTKEGFEDNIKQYLNHIQK